jgi:hypothetical protein
MAMRFRNEVAQHVKLMGSHPIDTLGKFITVLNLRNLISIFTVLCIQKLRRCYLGVRPPPRSLNKIPADEESEM